MAAMAAVAASLPAALAWLLLTACGAVVGATSSSSLLRTLQLPAVVERDLDCECPAGTACDCAKNQADRQEMKNPGRGGDTAGYQRVSDQYNVPDSVDYNTEDCSCSCCEVIPRMPEEIVVPSVYLKCALETKSAGKVPSVSSDTGTYQQEKAGCGGSCIVRGGVLDASENEVSDYNRFCFYQCQPYNYEVGNPCIGIDSEEKKKAQTKDQNAQDILVDPVVASESDNDQDAAHVVVGGPPPPPPGPPSTTAPPPCGERIPCIWKEMAEGRQKAANMLKQARDMTHKLRKLEAQTTGLLQIRKLAGLNVSRQ
eukprot:gnl/TRDRNA2_/TRDRNA2_180432_c0_seq1.p1 gnl/TRDRNA2_/TRDRNA2_180432_c0~~gnl/TRDRNA2_/TRDRNA2_180432_c0_seq1.p1  ORF type:complete len:312 (+),score=61.45 gnl/TRDRNA2_/TRDRNA2_180432_c0_seq1:71-1006(+)